MRVLLKYHSTLKRSVESKMLTLMVGIMCTTRPPGFELGTDGLTAAALRRTPSLPLVVPTITMRERKARFLHRCDGGIFVVLVFDNSIGHSYAIPILCEFQAAQPALLFVAISGSAIVMLNPFRTNSHHSQLVAEMIADRICATSLVQARN